MKCLKVKIKEKETGTMKETQDETDEQSNGIDGELKPCPFCGGPPIDNPSAGISCSQCNACGPFCGLANYTDGWNTRRANEVPNQAGMRGRIRDLVKERDEAERQRNLSQEESCSLLDENEKLKKRIQKGHCDGETILALQERVEELEELSRKDDLRIVALRSKSKELDKYLTLLEERAQTAVDTYKINHAEDCCVGDAIDALDTVLSEGVRDEEVPKEEWVKDIPEILKILRREVSTKKQRINATIDLDLKTRWLKETNRLSRFCEWVEGSHSAELKKRGGMIEK